MEHIAIDLGGRKSAICIRDEKGRIVQEQTIGTRHLDVFLGSRPKSRVIVETCAEAFGVADVAVAQGHEVRIVPSTLVRALGVGARGIKTDRRDAQALSQASTLQDLPTVHLRSQASRDLKSRLGMRSALVRSRTQQINCVRGFLRGQRTRPRGGDPATFAKRVRELGPTMEFVEVLLESIEHLSRQIAVCDKLIAKVVKGNEVCQRLMTVPGVGPITALSVMASLDEVGRFEGAHAVQSYLGLSPGENSSSLRVRKTSITKAGQVYARYALVQAAKSARRCRPSDPMVVWSRAIEDRKNSQIATVALARKMAGILFAIWRDGTTYRPNEGARMPETT